MSLSRTGNPKAPCESVDPTKLSGFNAVAGSRIKVGWDSGNRGGGFVRLALVPESDMTEAAFNRYDHSIFFNNSGACSSKRVLAMIRDLGDMLLVIVSIHAMLVEDAITEMIQAIIRDMIPH